MKKILALSLAAAVSVSLLAGCTGGGNQATTDEKGTTITVVTSYGGDDGNRKNYEEAVKAYETKTGNKVMDASATSNEEWKAKVLTDFETGTEPDVLFYFNNSDSDSFIKANKVVSIDEIKEVYPDFASNMKEDLLVPSGVDGKVYTVPVNGFWEAMFTNKKVLDAAGVEAPKADYSWDQFLLDCEKIKKAGYTPIAVSLNEVPHYWFEFAVYNNGTLDNHFDIPKSVDDETGKKWIAALEDIKLLYDKGYLPENTLTMSDAESVQMVYDGDAAFFIDGSWKVGNVNTSNKDNLGDFSLTYVPAKDGRKSTDIIGGISMGYYITRKAWDDPAKREAAIQFITEMTNDENVSKFSAVAVTALKNGATPASDLTEFDKVAVALVNQATSLSGGAVQDTLSSEVRGDLFASIPLIAAGRISAKDALAQALELNK